MERMTAGAKGKVLAEEPDGHVVVAGASVGAERDLVRPLSVDRALAQFTFAIDHTTTTIELVAARAHATCRRKRGSVRGACGRRQRGVSKKEQKGNIPLATAVEWFVMPDTIEGLRALERQVEMEWWWLNGALHAVAQLQAERAVGSHARIREMHAQVREIDRQRVQIAIRLA